MEPNQKDTTDQGASVSPRAGSAPSPGTSPPNLDSITNIKYIQALYAGTNSSPSKIYDKVTGDCGKKLGELEAGKTYYIAVLALLIGVKTFEAVFANEEVSQEDVNSIPGEHVVLSSVGTHKYKEPVFTLCFHKGRHSILRLNLNTLKAREITIVCRVPSPGDNPDTYTEATLRITVTPKNRRKPARPTPQLRKVLVLVPSDLHYFDHVCASLKEHMFTLHKKNENMALFSIATFHPKRVVVAKYSQAVIHSLERIAIYADYTLFIVPDNSDTPRVVKVQGTKDPLILTSEAPRGFSLCEANIDQFQMLEKTVIRSIMKSGSTLWLVPATVDIPLISEALHLTIVSYDARPCQRDLFTCWVGDNSKEQERKIIEKLAKIDLNLSDPEIVCYCSIGIIVRSDMWLWQLIDMMDDSDFESLGPTFQSVRQIDASDVQKYLQDPENKIYRKKLTALEKQIRFSAHPSLNHKMHRDISGQTNAQNPQKRKRNSRGPRASKRQRVNTTSYIVEEGNDNSSAPEQEFDPNGFPFEILTIFEEVPRPEDLNQTVEGSALSCSALSQQQIQTDDGSNLSLNSDDETENSIFMAG